MEGIVLDRASAYRGADLPRARRFTKILWALGVVIVFAVVPFHPPTAAIGPAGWWVVGSFLPLSVAMFALAARKTATFRVLLLVTYVGLAQITALQLLAGPEAPYLFVHVLLVCCVALTHPLPVALPFAGVVVAARVGLALVDGDARTAALVAAATESVISLVLAAVLCGVMREVREQRLELRDERSVDALTGLLNRRAFEELLAAQIAFHRRARRPLSLLVADLDGFKQLNDRFGHLEGDRQLVAAAEAVAGASRAGDMCFRWGGDEFAVLLPDTGDEDAALVAERLRIAVSDACSRPQPLTISIGHAELGDADGADELIARADEELLTRKRSRGSEIEPSVAAVAQRAAD